MTQYRQGDVLIVRLDGKMPEGCETVKRDKGRVVLAYGEVTGHAHAITGRSHALYTEPKAKRTFLRVVKTTAVLRHEEHETVKLPAGDYEIKHQREYTPEEIRRVAD